MCQKRLHFPAHQGRDMRDLFLGVAAVGPYQSRNCNVPVENSHITPLVDGGLDECDHWALPQVIGSHLERRTDQADRGVHVADSGVSEPSFADWSPHLFLHSLRLLSSNTTLLDNGRSTQNRANSFNPALC